MPDETEGFPPEEDTSEEVPAVYAQAGIATAAAAPPADPEPGKDDDGSVD